MNQFVNCCQLAAVQIEELINKWSVDLEEQEQMFMRQANQVNQWDKLLMSNAEQVLG